LVLLLGSCIALTGVLASSYVTNLYAFIILYGVFYGIGVGLTHLVPVIIAWEYFPNNKGMVSGIIFGGHGFGAFVFGLISFAIVNPNNTEPFLHVDGGNIFHP
jgi:OFA family oxalate/formate antiporter-like MFS transporter